ncbi:hypothetical protein Mal4_54140 [Maioricimonas rarisocia]|uniref:Uncharacterized protein n=1 Tax=Maioricimonas rarisocia TaxID=2528026 RepID=A0A517ZF43_9PLAN|nr:hypothetical protein [Maioricimonas rarisocia]QDU41049.1 hypothetical protein Mal4_54140 [Maioricimonas rarisocia]
MKAGFVPKKFTKKEWQDNRSRACAGSGVGKALDKWQKDCPAKISEMDAGQVTKAMMTAKALAAALQVAAKKCDKKKQKETLAGIARYEAIVSRYQTLLKQADVALKKRKSVIDSLNFRTVVNDKEILEVFTVFAETKAFIDDSLNTWLLCQKKKYKEAVERFSAGGKGGGDYNTDRETNRILYNSFVKKVYEDPRDVKAAVSTLERDQVQMLSDARHYKSFGTWDKFQEWLDKKFPIKDFSM